MTRDDCIRSGERENSYGAARTTTTPSSSSWRRPLLRTTHMRRGHRAPLTSANRRMSSSSMLRADNEQDAENVSRHPVEAVFVLVGICAAHKTPSFIRSSILGQMRRTNCGGRDTQPHFLSDDGRTARSAHTCAGLDAGCRFIEGIPIGVPGVSRGVPPSAAARRRVTPRDDATGLPRPASPVWDAGAAPRRPPRWPVAGGRERYAPQRSPHAARRGNADDARGRYARRALPQRGQTSGSTSKIRRSNSAQRRRASPSAEGVATSRSSGENERRR